MCNEVHIFVSVSWLNWRLREVPEPHSSRSVVAHGKTYQPRIQVPTKLDGRQRRSTVGNVYVAGLGCQLVIGDEGQSGKDRHVTDLPSAQRQQPHGNFRREGDAVPVGVNCLIKLAPLDENRRKGL
jgi:hypothetical protein